MGKFEKKDKRPSQAQEASSSQKKPSKKRAAILIGSICAAAVVLLGAVAGFFLLRDDGKIAGNLYIAGVDLGGMTREEAKIALADGIKFYSEENMNIELYTRDYPLFTSTIDPKQIQQVDIFGNPIDPTGSSDAPEESETPSESAAPSETEDNTEPSDPSEPSDTPLDENGQPMKVAEQICLTPSDTNVSLDVDAAVEAAYKYGRSGGLFSRAKKTLSERTNLDVSEYLTLDESYIRTLLEEYAADSTSTLTEADLKQNTTSSTDEEGNPIEVTTLSITLGSAGRSIDLDALYQTILTAYAEGNFTLQYVYQEELPQPFDLDALYETHYKAPVNAVCNPETFEISESINGYGFDLNHAIELLSKAKPGDTVELTLSELEPQYTTEKLQSQLFKDVLSSCDTPHDSQWGRTRNLELACKAINGTILMPGDVFSYNGVVGERTAAKGYQEGGVYVGGETVQQLGGGVCQVASNLYYCTLKADLEVVKRTEHQYAPWYITYGMDATVYYGQIDYQFRNNTAFPIRIDAWVSGGYVHVEFVGTETKDYTVKLDYRVLSKNPFEIKYIDVYPGMPNYDKYKDFDDGDVVATAYTGYEIDTYMYKYDKDGNEISCDYIDHTSYDRRDKLIVHIVNDPDPTDPPTEPPTTPPTDEPTDPPTEEPTDPPEENPTDPSEDIPEE